jgi:hypothetical protein
LFYEYDLPSPYHFSCFHDSIFSWTQCIIESSSDELIFQSRCTYMKKYPCASVIEMCSGIGVESSHRKSWDNIGHILPEKSPISRGSRPEEILKSNYFSSVYISVSSCHSWSSAWCSWLANSVISDIPTRNASIERYLFLVVEWITGKRSVVAI